jgi:hypothetical protein
MSRLVLALVVSLSACGSPERSRWHLHMDGETLHRTFSLKGWCRERAMRLQAAYPDHTFECVEQRFRHDFFGNERAA